MQQGVERFLCILKESLELVDFHHFSLNTCLPIFHSGTFQCHQLPDHVQVVLLKFTQRLNSVNLMKFKSIMDYLFLIIISFS